MLDRLTDNLEIRRNATGNPAAARTTSARARRRDRERDHGRRNNRLYRNGPHGRTDGRPPARRRLFAVHLRYADPRRPSRWSRAARGWQNRPPKSPRSADIVLASLPTPDIVKAVALGPDGIIAGNRASILIDLSTTGPGAAKLIAEGFEAPQHHAGRCAGQRRHQGRGERHARGDGVLPEGNL